MFAFKFSILPPQLKFNLHQSTNRANPTNPRIRNSSLIYWSKQKKRSLARIRMDQANYFVLTEVRAIRILNLMMILQRSIKSTLSLPIGQTDH